MGQVIRPVLKMDGHGTHCAGTAGGKTVGVAPGATVAAVKVLFDSGSGSLSYILGALDWVVQQDARSAVASMSLGGQGRSSSEKIAIDAAVSKGVVVVVAAGNANVDACKWSPAYVAKAITGGSIDYRYQRTEFSNFGKCVDIWAPGSGILSTSHSNDGGYTTWSGSSMACPHVSGAAALIMGERMLGRARCVHA